MEVFLLGYPGEVGGACTEAWHTVRIWRQLGIDVTLVPTWHAPENWRRACADIGCRTVDSAPGKLADVPGLAGSVVVSFCNSEFLSVYKEVRDLGCRVVWCNCMTFLFEQERDVFRRFGLPEKLMFQSDFQRSELEPLLREFGHSSGHGVLIRGAFDFAEFKFLPRSHKAGEPFVIGRMARPDPDKWSSNTWPIYSAVQYQRKRAMMLGVDERTLKKIGPTPTFGDCLKPNAMPVQDYLAVLHCLLPINGGARENWPRAGLEAMAAGVPVVAQNEWGWREMIVHGETGFLASNDCELAHYTACLAYDEPLRLRIAENARKRLESELASPDVIGRAWTDLFASMGAE